MSPPTARRREQSPPRRVPWFSDLFFAYLCGRPGRAACGPQHLGTTFEHRRRGDAERAPSGEPDPSQADQVGLCLGQDRCRSPEDPASRAGAGRLAAHPGAGGLRSDPLAGARGGGRVNAETGKRPRRCPRTMGTGRSEQLRGHMRNLLCHNRTSRRSAEGDVSTGLIPQTVAQASILAAFSAAC